MRRVTSSRNLATLIGLVLLTACATPETTPSAARTTLDPAASRWFQLEWSSTPETNDTRRVDGYIRNTYGEAAQVQLLVQALDPSGNVVGHTLDYPQFPVPGFGRSYFNVAHVATADHYQVTVWTAYFIQGRRLGP